MKAGSADKRACRHFIARIHTHTHTHTYTYTSYTYTFIHTQVKQTVLTKELVATILREYKVMHAEVILKEDCTEDDFIDVLEGMRP